MDYTKDHVKLTRDVGRIMERAITHAEALVTTQLRTEMSVFVQRLKPSTELRYIDGMGTRFFCIVCANGHQLYVTLHGIYYGAFPGFFCGPRNESFVKPLTDLLQFVNQIDNDYRLSFGDFRLKGTKGK